MIPYFSIYYELLKDYLTKLNELQSTGFIPIFYPNANKSKLEEKSKITIFK